MTKKRYCQYCGAEFTTDNNRKIFCSGNCKRKSHQKRRAKPLVNHPKITIEDMVDEMIRLSDEKGRSVQYGELQKLMLTGRHTMGK